MREYQSWGRYPKTVQKASSVFWRSYNIFSDTELTLLPYGCGRSYGDCCLNDGGLLVDMRGLDRFIAFDPEQGLLRCEAGVTLAQILEFVVPRGWFLPVVPGTKFVTVGGAIANDIHGKNHHSSGTFGCHVTQFELLRSDGQRLLVSQDSNEAFYRATIGGLGLTGIILWAELKLKKIDSPWIDAEFIKFDSLDDFFPLAEESSKEFEYTVSWVDSSSRGKGLGRGIFIRGNHAGHRVVASRAEPKQREFSLPFDMPSFVLNRLSIKTFNMLYYHKQREKVRRQLTHYSSFFFPLDALSNWNRMYGRRGFFQYQSVLPLEIAQDKIRSQFEIIAESGQGSFLSVLKDFGSVPSPGMMSFPQPGLTLALDFPNRGKRTLSLFDRLDGIVREHGGRLYPAKDARMSAESFGQFFPQCEEFSQFIDPRISSSFWRRVARP